MTSTAHPREGGGAEEAMQQEHTRTEVVEANFEREGELVTVVEQREDSID